MLPYAFNKLGINSLPYKRELDYVEATGTQFVSARLPFIQVGNTTRWRLEFMPTGETVGTYFRFTAGTVEPGQQLQPINFYNGTTYNQGVQLPAANNVKHTYEYRQNGFCYLDGASKGSLPGTPETWSGEMSYLLFTYTGSPPYRRGRFYRHTIYNGDGVTIADFLPVMSNDNKPCIYERITKALIPNGGADDFLYGEK